MSCLLFAAACGGSSTAKPDAMPDAAADAAPDGDTATKIAITSDVPLLLAAFRDGIDAPWQAATRKTATSYEAAVHGPYIVAVVYDTGDATMHSFNTDELAQNLDDDHAVTITTQFTGTTTGSNVTGKIVQPGRVFLGDGFAISSSKANWDLAMAITPGTYDLWAFSPDHAFAHHALDATHDVALGTLDVNAQGMPLATVAFTATNSTAGEVLTSRAAIQSPTTFFASVSRFGDASATKVVPEALLTATDRQSVSVFGTTGGHQRTLRLPYHAGGSTAYTLPSLLSGVSWTTAPDLTAHWTALGTVSSFDLFASSETSGPTSAAYSLDASPSFLAATHVTQLTLDTNLPGYQAAWKIDLAGPYEREISALHAPAASTVESETYFEELNAPASVTQPREVRRRGLPR